jgi:hypothetical protein
MFFMVSLVGIVFSLFNKRFLFLFFAAILTLLAFMRFGIGLDYFGYEYLYNRLQSSILNEYKYGLDNQEIGFRMIGSFLKSLGLSYQQYLMVFAALNIFFIAKISQRYSKNPTLSLLIFFCFYYLTWTLSGIRQGFVITIGMYFLLRAIEKNETIKFILVVLLLSLAHSSSFILLVMYFVSKINFSKNNLIIIASASVTLSLIPTGALISKLTWIPFYYRISPYLETERALNLWDFQSFGRMFFMVLAFVFYNYYSKQSEMHKKVMNLYIISLCLYFVLQFSELTAGRISIYGKFLDIIIIANVLYMFKEAINRLLYLLGIIALCFLYLFKEGQELERGISKTDSDLIFAPYVNVFNKDDYHFKSEYFKLEIN